MWKSLAKRPVLVAIVHFATNEEQEIVSRFCSASVVCISADKQNEIDADEGKADVEMQVNNVNVDLPGLGICKEQFVIETPIEEKFEDKWYKALQKIRQFGQSNMD